MSVKKLKQLEDLKNQRLNLESQYLVKKTNFKNTESGKLFNAFEQSLNNEGFTVSPQPTGITGVYNNLNFSALINEDLTEGDQGLAIFTDVEVSGGANQKYQVCAFDVLNPNPPSQEVNDTEPDTDAEIDQRIAIEEQLILYYQGFLDPQTVALYNYTLQSQDLNERFTSLDELVQKIFN